MSDQRLTERELQAHHSVGEALREWESLEGGVVALLRGLGMALEYPLGSLWHWKGDVEALVCRAFWCAPHADAGDFEAAQRARTLHAGEDHQGRAWETLRPVVTADVAEDATFGPTRAAADLGLRSAISFPAVGDTGPVAVLSFYSFEHRVPSEGLIRTLADIGRELGRFLERRRADLGWQPLSEREQEVLRLAAAGNSGPEIATILMLSPSTVKTHFEHIFEKLGVGDRAAAVAQALRTGLLR